MDLPFFRPLGLAALAVLAMACNSGGGDDTGTKDGISGVSCSGSVCTLSGVVTDDITMTADIDWVLRGGVFIGDDIEETVLEIEPGTTIYGESSTDGMLVIRRNSRILANGTAEAPIVFTSSKEKGTRARGDWGGLIINGNARINSCAEDGSDTVCEAFGEGGTGWYGGDDDTDDSGVLHYVRVEFAGTLISPENELNGIALQGVGSGTDIDHIQVHYNADDGIEFFGGAAQVKHVYITGAGDDSLDWTDGFRGKVQFAVLQQYDDASDNGIEADNNGDANDATPLTRPILSNLTIIGSPDSGKSDVGMLLREGTGGEIHNAIVQGFNDICMEVVDDVTIGNVASGDLVLKSSIFWMCGDATDFPSRDNYYNGDGQTLFDRDGAGNTLADPLLGDPTNESAPDFVPGTGSPALTGGVVPSDPFFDSVTFRGGVDPDDDWLTGWTTAAPN